MYQVHFYASVALALVALGSWGCQASTHSQGTNAQSGAAGQTESYLCASSIGGATISVQKTDLGERIAFDAPGTESGTLRRAVLGSPPASTARLSAPHLIATNSLPTGVQMRAEETSNGAAIVYTAGNANEGQLMHDLVDADVARLESGGCAVLEAIQTAPPAQPRRVHRSPAQAERSWDSSGSDFRGH